MKFAGRKNMTLLFLLFMSIILMGIGYASIESITGEISGKVVGSAQNGVFITNVEYVSDVDANLNNSKIEKIAGSMMQSTVELSKTNLDSQITYKVTVYNSSTEEVPFTEVLHGDEFYDNADITFDLSGFTIGQVIAPKETKEIIITFKYNTSTGVIPDNTVLNSYLRFKLDIPNRMVLATTSASTEKYLTGSIAKESIETVKFEKGTAPDVKDAIMFDASEKQDESIIGYYTDTDGNGLYELTFVSNDIIYANKNAQYLFQNLTNVTEFDFDNFSTFGVNSMNSTFEACNQMTTLELKSLDMSRVTDMGYMFTKCEKLESLDLNNWDTSNVTNMTNMFNQCSKLTSVNLSSLKTSKVTNMSQMFRACYALESIDVSGFDTSNVTNMNYMFVGLYKVPNLDVSNFNTKKVINMLGVFQDCTSITELNLENWNTDNAKNISALFSGCSRITELDLTNFNTNNVTDMRWLFNNCYTLKTVYVKEYNSTTNTGWTIKNSNSSYAGVGMFTNATKIVGGNGTVYDSNYNTIEYARIDTDDTPGYFTKKGQTSSEYVPADPYLPTGFAQVEGTTLDNGFTIQDSTGNQYVWIEVPKTKDVYSTADLKITEFTADEYTKIETDLHTYTSDYRQDGYTDEYSSDEATGLASDEYTALKQKMLKSIYQNEGFYIGKYETGIEDTPRTSSSADTAPTETPVIKQNMYPYNWVTCSQAQALASSMEKGGYNTSLMFGVQWDLVMKYLETKGVPQADLKTDSTSWGNYCDNLWNITNANLKYSINYGLNWTSGAYGTKDSTTSILLSTGASEAFGKQGIYDLAGNVFEWTLEHSNSITSNPCVQRSGCFYKYGNGYPSATHYPVSIKGTKIEDGFRVALY